MEQAANFDPTPEDAAKIFEDVALRQTGDSSATTIDLNGLFDTELMFFLSYPQVHRIIKGLKVTCALNNNGRNGNDDTSNFAPINWAHDDSHDVLAKQFDNDMSRSLAVFAILR